MKLHFKLSQKAISEQFAKGNVVDEHQIQEIDFDKLTDHKRFVLTYYCFIYNKDLYLKSYHEQTIHDPKKLETGWKDIVSYSDSLNCLEELVNRYQELLDKKKKEEAETQKIQAFNDEAERLKELLKDTDLRFESHQYDFTVTAYFNRETYKSKSLTLEEMKADIKAGKVHEWYQQQKAIKLAEVQKEKDRIARIVAGKETLKNWAMDNGSEKLQLLIIHEKDWYELAVVEFALTKIPEFNNGYILNSNEIESAEMESVSFPSTDQLVILDQFSQKYPFDFDIVKFDRDEETYISCNIPLPTGEEVILYKALG